MKIAITGSGTSGSWIIRGQQLGLAIGAEPVMGGSFKSFDAAIIVKRARGRADCLARLKAERIPIIYDVVDGWPQPDGNKWGRNWCIDWMQQQLRLIQPKAIVAATQVMANDAAKLVSLSVPILALPHHALPAQPLNPIREQVRRVGYMGSDRHLGSWGNRISCFCAQRGWEFAMNPTTLAEIDIVIALREHTGYAARNWKSNVKLVNAQATGTPCILARESGYIETASGAENWADNDEELLRAFDELTDYQTRRDKSDQLLEFGKRFALESIAATYKEWLCKLKF